MAARLRRRAALLALARAFRPGAPGVFRRLMVMPRLIRASLRGEYDGGLRLFLMATASLYIVSPLDAIPELITGIFGLIDDAVVVTWLVGALLSETERFLEWERRGEARPSVIKGEVVG